jgi:hypothetical protein
MSPAEKSFDQLRVKLEQLEKLFPGTLKNSEELKQVAMALLIHECVPESMPLIGKQEAAPQLSALPDADECTPAQPDKDEERIDLVSYWEKTFDGEIVRKMDLQNAAKMQYKGDKGELPPQRLVAIKMKWGGVREFPAYFYPRKWLADFLKSHREDFPHHWSKCSA